MRGVYRGIPSGIVTDPWIIPACAGFTAQRREGRLARADHPRMRGVYALDDGATIEIKGSSPLARGLRRGPGRGESGRRIIPARAGFTPRSCEPARAREDHPRSRGVYMSADGVLFGRDGSSPLARGLRSGLRAMESAGRIIPARAGFTSRLGS